MPTYYTLAEVAAVFARLDDIGDDEHAAFEKHLRNLVQRNHLPPASTAGRAFLYDRAGVASIRIALIASRFSIGRMALESLTAFLARPIWTGNDGPQPAERDELVWRASAGDDCHIAIVMDTRGRHWTERRWSGELDWLKPSQTSPRVIRATAMVARDDAPEVARFVLPAGEIVRELLAALPEGAA